MTTSYNGLTIITVAVAAFSSLVTVSSHSQYQTELPQDPSSPRDVGVLSASVAA